MNVNTYKKKKFKYDEYILQNLFYLNNLMI